MKVIELKGNYVSIKLGLVSLLGCQRRQLSTDGRGLAKKVSLIGSNKTKINH